MKIKTRIAPSPTGYLHIGTARTALFSYLYAKQNDGEFILRIEDTDRDRSTKEFEEDIINSLNWLGLHWDDLYRQSERTDIYRKYLEKMIKENKAYISKEEPVKEGGRSEVIRFKNPNKNISFIDEIRGEISVDTTDLGDFVIAKDLDTPLFHLTVVVDDYEMAITNIIRGEDHISNTPRQILIAEAIGAPIPKYAHLPLILAPDRSKMSKRHGAVSISTYKEEGYLKEAIINFLVLLGWSPQAGDDKTNEEIFTLEELLKRFDLKEIGKSGAIFNIEKLNWLNSKYIQQLPLDTLATEIEKFLPEISTFPDNRKKAFIELITERIEKFKDIEQLKQEGEWDYFFKTPEINKDLIKTTEYLEELANLLNEIDEKNFTKENIKEKIWDFATEKGRGETLGPMRIALSGKKQSPDPFTIAEILGKEETIQRLKIIVL